MPGLCFRGFLLDFRSFSFERHEDNFFVELARLIVLFHVGLDCFVSRRTFPFGFFCAAFCWSSAFGVSFLLGFCWRQEKCLFEFARLIFLFGFVGVAQLFVWLSQFFCFCFSRGRDNLLVGLWEFCFNVWLLPF